MPRGRQRPPQESIDSILLAICRRDDLDNETLQHYFNRLRMNGLRKPAIRFYTCCVAAIGSAYCRHSYSC